MDCVGAERRREERHQGVEVDLDRPRRVASGSARAPIAPASLRGEVIAGDPSEGKTLLVAPSSAPMLVIEAPAPRLRRRAVLITLPTPPLTVRSRRSPG